jgi:hypothetical protein
LQKYERPDIKTKIEISKSLDCGVNRGCKEKDSSVSEDPMPMAEKRNSTKEELQHKHMERKRARLEIPEGSYFDRCILTSINLNNLSLRFIVRNIVEQLVHV